MATVCGAALAAALCGCSLLNLDTFLNPELLTSLGLGEKVATLPGDAPGLLVATANRTSRPCHVFVSYRDPNDNVQTYTANLAAGDETAQMLVCPVQEITLGDVSNLQTAAARVYLVAGTVTDATTLASAPYIEVDAFGVLLREEVNYNCGDGLTFTIEESALTRSGYQAFAYIRPASGQ
jgi:hypothetical protein